MPARRLRARERNRLCLPPDLDRGLFFLGIVLTLHLTLMLLHFSFLLSFDSRVPCTFYPLGRHKPREVPSHLTYTQILVRAHRPFFLLTRPIY